MVWKFLFSLFHAVCWFYIPHRVVSDDVAGGNVYDIIARNCPRFAQLVNKAKFSNFLSDPTDFTLFAPNDTAFENLSKERLDYLQNLDDFETLNFVKFYTIHRIRLDVTHILNDDIRDSMAPSGRLFFNQRTRSNWDPIGVTGTSEFYVNGGKIIHPNIQAENGIVHIIDHVLFPTSADRAYGYVLNPEDNRVKTSKFRRLLSFVPAEFYDPVQRMDSLLKITLFVPSDAAFDKIPKEKLLQLEGEGRRLKTVLQMHFIPNQFVFTSWIQHNEGFLSEFGPSITFRRPLPDKVYVYSGGASGLITHGNITVNNGVIHVIDTLLGFVYFSCMEQIENDAMKFFRLVNRGQTWISKALLHQTGVTVFVPTNEAFANLKNVPWINLNDQLLLDKVLEMHILQQDESIQVNLVNGDYNSRQFRRSLYSGWPVTVYNQRNETWVHGGLVRAQVVRPDVETTNGRIHFVDSLFGVPYMDIPATIYYDEWLTRTYDVLNAIGLTTYLRDVRYNPTSLPKRNFRNPSSNFGGKTIAPYSGNLPYQGVDPCSGCEFTFFVPNGTEIDNFHLLPAGQRLMQDADRMRYILKRHLFLGKPISLEKMSNGRFTFHSVTGDEIRVTKYADRNVELLYSNKRARVILMDVGATNGLIHIIDRILFVNEDVYRVMSGSTALSVSVVTTFIILVAQIFFWHY